MQVVQCKSGFVAIVGPTNSGKSTLVNALVGKKVSITSPKVQTTYRGVSGIRNTEGKQIIFTDTPGFQKNPEKVARMLNDVADRRARDCDAAVWVFDVSDKRVVENIVKFKTKVQELKGTDRSFCVLNKVDKLPKPALLPIIQAVWELGIFSEVIPLSARKNEIDPLLKVVDRVLTEGPRHFSENSFSDRPESFHLAEAVREKIYQATFQELPYSSWIEIEEGTEAFEKSERVPTIYARIHVDSESRKAILIGKGGEMLKEIGTRARQDIEELLGHQVCLKLHVDVQKSWREDGNFLKNYLELDR